nr:unknown [Picea sitchensis]
MALVEPPLVLHNNTNSCPSLFPLEVTTAAGTETDAGKSQAPAAQGEG